MFIDEEKFSNIFKRKTKFIKLADNEHSHLCSKDPAAHHQTPLQGTPSSRQEPCLTELFLKSLIARLTNRHEHHYFTLI